MSKNIEWKGYDINVSEDGVWTVSKNIEWKGYNINLSDNGIRASKSYEQPNTTYVITYDKVNNAAYFREYHPLPIIKKSYPYCGWTVDNSDNAEEENIWEIHRLIVKQENYNLKGEGAEFTLESNGSFISVPNPDALEFLEPYEHGVPESIVKDTGFSIANINKVYKVVNYYRNLDLPELDATVIKEAYEAAAEGTEFKLKNNDSSSDHMEEVYEPDLDLPAQELAELADDHCENLEKWNGYTMYSNKDTFTAFKNNQQNGIWATITYNKAKNEASYYSNHLVASSWRNKEVYQVKEEGTEFTLENKKNYLENFSGEREDSTTPPGHQYDDVYGFVNYCRDMSELELAKLGGDHDDTDNG